MKGKDSIFIVVDTQRGVIAGKRGTERVVRNITEAAARARSVGMTVVWVQHEDDTLVKGSETWSLAEGLTPLEGDLFIGKRYNSSFEETELDAILRKRGIRTVILAGAATNWCIRATAYGALDRGYNLVILSDAHTTGNLDIPGGPSIPAEFLIAELNVALGNVEYPGRTSRAIKTDEFVFD